MEFLKYYSIFSAILPYGCRVNWAIYNIRNFWADLLFSFLNDTLYIIFTCIFHFIILFHDTLYVTLSFKTEDCEETHM